MVKVKKERILSLRLEMLLWRKIQQEAEEEGITASAVIRRTLMRAHGRAATAS